MPSNEQLLQYVAVGIPNEQSEVNIREIAVFLFEDTLYSVLNSEADDISYQCLENEFRRSTPFDAVVESGIDIKPEMQAIEQLAIQIIESIDSYLNGALTFQQMWALDKKHAFSEIRRTVGHGTSFWWHHEYNDFGFDYMPETDDFESPYDATTQIIDKLVTYIQQQLA